MIGRVVSTKMNKQSLRSDDLKQSLSSNEGRTAAVLVERMAQHPLYKKTFVQSKKYLVDDPIGVKDGDMVELIKVRPISKNKHWKIVRVVGKDLKEIMEETLKNEAEKVIAEVMPEEQERDSVQDTGFSEEEKIKKKEKAKPRKEKLASKS